MRQISYPPANGESPALYNSCFIFDNISKSTQIRFFRLEIRDFYNNDIQNTKGVFVFSDLYNTWFEELCQFFL